MGSTKGHSRIWLVASFSILICVALVGPGSAQRALASASAAPGPPIYPAGEPRIEGNGLASSQPTATASAPTVWFKDPGNPVLNNASAPSVVYANNHYEMWYAASGEIGFATSPDGLNWTNSPSNPVLRAGGPGAWDGGYVYAPDVIFDAGAYKMWYRGSNSAQPDWPTGCCNIGYATSTDGVNWVKHSANPVLEVGSANSWDSSFILNASVLVDGGTYEMWYSGCRASTCQIGYATSPDGLSWTKYAGNPVLTTGSAGSWDGSTASYPAVMFDGSTYEMWYSGFAGSSSSAIGYATSPDGISWSKYPNPILTKGPANSWDGYGVVGPAVLVHDGKYKMWYAGGASDFVVTQIGYAARAVARNFLPAIVR